MTEFFGINLTEADPATFWKLVGRLGLATVLGWVVSTIFRWTRRNELVTPTLPPTLVLLSVLIAMVTQVIGNNVALAFSLVGALSIVRFRTVVQDTRDTAFVMFAVIVGMAVGAGHPTVAFVGIAFVGVAAQLLSKMPGTIEWTQIDSILTVRVGLGPEPQAIVESHLKSQQVRFELMAISTVRQRTAIEMQYRLRLDGKIAPSEVVRALNQLEGVQSVELQRPED
jgi:uncharacterized membrane protein YhiD involved in acid resistance